MKTKRKRKYKTKAGSFAKEIEDPIQRTRGEINLQELQDIIREEQFMQDIEQLDPLLARLDQLNEENQNRGRIFRRREEEEERQFNRNVRRRTAGKKRKKRKTRRRRSK